MAPCPSPERRGSSAASFFRAPEPSCADRVSSDPSRVLMEADAARDGKRRRRHGGDDDSRASKKRAVGRVASPVAHLSCARIRPFVRASLPKEETQVTARAVAGDATTKQNTGESISSTKIESASLPKKGTFSSTQVSSSTRSVARGVIMKQKAGQNIPRTRIIRPAVQASGIKDKTKIGVLRNDGHGVITAKQEASQRVKATVPKSIPAIRPSAPATNHQDPHAPQDALRAALAAARQAQDRRRHNVYARQREAARRELDKVVRTVFFNDSSITLEGVLKSLAC